MTILLGIGTSEFFKSGKVAEAFCIYFYFSFLNFILVFSFFRLE